MYKYRKLKGRRKVISDKITQAAYHVNIDILNTMHTNCTKLNQDCSITKTLPLYVFKKITRLSKFHCFFTIIVINITFSVAVFTRKNDSNFLLYMAIS